MKRVMPWLVLILGAAALVVLYPNFPDRWPVHWGIDGQPNGWTNKTPMGAGFPLIMAGVLTFVFQGLAWTAGKFRNSRLPAEWAERMVLANQNYLHYLAGVLNLFMGYLAVTLPYGPPSPAAPLVLVLASIAYPAYDFYQLASEMRRQGALPKGYKGLLYSNPDDPRIWVPKLGGYGWTLNFAHTRSRLMMLALLALPLLMVAATLVAMPR